MNTRSKVYVQRAAVRRLLDHPTFLAVTVADARQLRTVYRSLLRHGYHPRQARYLIVTVLGVGVASRLTISAQLVSVTAELVSVTA